MNHFIVNDKIKDVDSLVEFLKTKLGEIDNFYGNKDNAPYISRRVVNDVKMVIETAWLWEPLAKSYKEIYGNKSRRSTLDFYKSYTYNTTGIYSLCKNGAVGNSPEYPVITKLLEKAKPKIGN